MEMEVPWRAWDPQRRRRLVTSVLKYVLNYTLGRLNFQLQDIIGYKSSVVKVGRISCDQIFVMNSRSEEPTQDSSPQGTQTSHPVALCRLLSPRQSQSSPWSQTCDKRFRLRESLASVFDIASHKTTPQRFGEQTSMARMEDGQSIRMTTTTALKGPAARDRNKKLPQQTLHPLRYQRWRPFTQPHSLHTPVLLIMRCSQSRCT